jgi:hypothetical protein
MTMGNAATRTGGSAFAARRGAVPRRVGGTGGAFVPTDDAQVLERLPGGSAMQLRQLKSMQAAAAQSPNDLARATALATANIRASVQGDPRFPGYAGGARAVVEGPAAPTPILLLRATILQSSHQFDPALADLDAC